jgi:hypothetical protein
VKLSDRIDNFLLEREKLSGRECPFRNRGYVIVAFGYWWGVDPRFCVGVSGAETTYGMAEKTGIDVTVGHNAWGITKLDGSGDRQLYANWFQGFWNFYRIIRNYYIDKGLETVDSLQLKWVGYPESDWTRTVKWTIGQLGGDPEGSIKLPRLDIAPAPQ